MQKKKHRKLYTFVSMPSHSKHLMHVFKCFGEQGMNLDSRRVPFSLHMPMRMKHM